MCKYWLEPVVLAANDGFSPAELNRIRALIIRHLEHILEAGMNTVVNSEPRIIELKVTDESIIAQLADGRTVSVRWRGHGVYRKRHTTSGTTLNYGKWRRCSLA